VATRYHRVTLDFVREWDGPGTTVVALTLEQQDDPRFRGFIELVKEIRNAEVAAEIAAKGPGGLYW
jgi:hypothetical protein